MNPFSRLRRHLPDRETLQRNRWLRWIGPRLFHYSLWHFSRHGVALGVALGIFFGLLIPLAQIPAAAGAAVLLRANVPAAIASTLVTNPLTYAPIYYVAWKLGSRVLGREGGSPPVLPTTTAAEAEKAAEGSLSRAMAGGLHGVGQPLALGLALMACSLGLFTYFAISWGWVLKVNLSRLRRQRRQRRLRRERLAAAAGPHTHKG